MPLKKISTDQAPGAIGPYSQAVQAGNLVFVSGQIPLDPATGQVVSGGVSEQTTRVLENIKAILAAAGLDLSQVVKSEVFIKDMNQFAEMNAVYARYFQGEVLPARYAVEVARLPKDVLIEIAVTAWRD